MPELEDEDLPVQDELETLKQRADSIGLTYHPSIKVEKLREKVLAALTEEPKPVKKEEVVEKETLPQYNMRKRREASELIRIRVTCMNPAKTEWDGEFFTAGNSVVGTHTKFVPFNAEDGYHVPRIIYNQIVDRKCQVFTTVKAPNGMKMRQGKLIKEFAIEVLPNLTQVELNELARRQAMSQAID